MGVNFCNLFDMGENKNRALITIGALNKNCVLRMHLLVNSEFMGVNCEKIFQNVR